jgi:hypothetical protein
MTVNHRKRFTRNSRHHLGDAPIEERFHRQMLAVGSTIDEVFNGTRRGEKRETGFVLLVFPFGDDPKGRCNFISNGADRKDIIVLFKEMIARFEGQPEIPEGRA